MHEGKGPLAEDLEKFLRDNNICYQIRAMGPASYVLGREYDSFLKASEDFAILSGGKFIPDNDIEKIGSEIKKHYITDETILISDSGRHDMLFIYDQKKVVVNMTPFEREIRITVFEERELDEKPSVRVPQTQTFKM
jgi:hypothetical protein